ncbi:hypothetical protein [Paracidovorax cattleyae]|uniref:Rubrerythrin n=1 Tax=Paracidovorax cattleyae TaxID=80868 RepID=A0A1H0R5V4_9BURK|nr:hypothetical protein [Paracidovorax cattleyae]SDP24922.1 hypothetical protein SAMN04489708_109163 [Paracidovorax cattleyae]
MVGKPISKLDDDALTRVRAILMNGEPVARQLYAEIASVESQHITHYGSMPNPHETPLEKLLIAEACEVWNYAGCAQQESNPRVRAIWEMFRDYELGHFQVVQELFKRLKRCDPAKVLGDGALPAFIRFESHRDYLRQVADAETDLRKDGMRFAQVPQEEGESSLAYREAVDQDGSPSCAASASYAWTAGTELVREAEAVEVVAAT